MKPFLLFAVAALAWGCSNSNPNPPERAPDPAPTVEPAPMPDPVPPQPPALDLTARLGVGEVAAGRVTDPASLIGGIKAEGRVRDIKIYNSKVAFIIEGARRARNGYRFWGGNVIDADVVRAEGEPGQDLFNEVGQSFNIQIFRPDRVEVISDGRDGRAHVRFTGKDATFDWAESFVRDLLNPPVVSVDVIYDYILEPDDDALLLRTTITNTGSEVARMDFPLMLSNQGDGLRQWQRDNGFDIDMTGLDTFRLTSRDYAVGWWPMDSSATLLFEYSNVELILMDAFQLEVGAQIVRETRLTVTDQGTSGIDRIRAGYESRTMSEIEGTVSLPGSVAAESAYAVAWLNGAPYTMAPVDAEGRFALAVDPGEYGVEVYAPRHAPTGVSTVSVAESGNARVDLSMLESGRIAVTVVDGEGERVPARVMFVVPEGDDTPEPFSPEAARVGRGGEWRWTSERNGGRISGVGYAVDGTTEMLLPAGTYKVGASRGFSYEIDEKTVTVEPGGRVEVGLSIEKVVDTSGWMSSDFHIHALRSPDSDTPYDIRAMQALTDDLDIPILTEHVALDGLGKTVEKMGIADKVVGIYAQEVTSFAYGHFNAFPLTFKPDAVNTGAVFPYDKQPAQLFDAIRAQGPGDEIIQVNHPRGASQGSYFSAVGFDAETGEVSNPDLWSTNWDAIEAQNGNCDAWPDNAIMDDWAAMTNRGLIKTFASGSDSHRENDPIGFPRNWIKIDRQSIDASDNALVDAVRNRRMFVSCGPFVRFETADGSAGLGDMAGLNERGLAVFRVQVQAPSWLQLDEARLVKNGEPIDSVPIGPGSGVRLETTFVDTPNADAWYAIEVVGSGSTLPVHRSGPPHAFTNPIEIDVDGDGQWTPPLAP